jgi:hypothetical protein
MKPTTSPYIIVRKSSIHNRGVFARKDIPKGARVIEYVGEKVTKKEAEDRVTETIGNADENNGAVYIFELNKRHDIDGKVPYNTARFINHSCDPNCETEIIRGHIWITALRDIKKGEEISYNYGYGPDEFEDHPCRCGSKNCIGYIVAEEHWRKVRKILARRDETG